MASFEKISSEQMDNFMDVLGFKELSIKERTGNLRRTVKEKVYEKDFGAGKIRIYSSVAGVESRDVGKDAIRVQYWVDGVKVYGAIRVNRVKNWRKNVLNRIYSLEDMVSKGSLRKVPKDSSGSPMVVRKARRGGKKFWGSSDYPRNNETRRFDAAVVMTGKPVTAVEKAMAWNRLIKQADLHQMLMELEHNVRIGLIDEDEIMSSLKEKFGAEDEPMWCACGCDGKIADHDDRGYGCWPCIECGDDSDTDINEMCSDCELDIHEAEYNTVANSPLGEIVTDDNGRRFVLVDEEFAQIIFEQSPVFRAPSSPVVLDSVEEMLKTTRKRLNAEDRDESERMTRAEAEALADKMTKLLNPFVDFVEVCGSYRRGREDPGDLDIVIILKENESLPAIVEKLVGQYTAVNWLGEKKTQIVVDGVKVDIKVSSLEGLGAALLYFTGPGGYNIGMRRSAKSKGLKLNEYGIWTRDTNVYLGGATEEEIYAVLDKTYKPPEMRAEDYGVGALWMAEDEEEIDDEDYWEPYLEALEELNGEIGQYVNYASSEYVGIVECISLWQNVAEDSAHTLSYVANKVHKFKMDAFRYIWEQDVNYVWENLSSETRNLLENFNPEDRYYEGDVVFTDSFGWPNLSQLKDTINPYWLQNMENESYAFDLYRSD